MFLLRKWCVVLLGLAVTQVACSKEAQPRTGPPLLETVNLINGSFDIPYFLEPSHDIRLVLREIKLDRLENEYSKFQPTTLKELESTAHPLRISAYKYSPRLDDIVDVLPDEAAQSANGWTQVCGRGRGCIGFYMRGEVIALEFKGELEAATYMKDLLASDLTKNTQQPARLLDRYGARFINSSLAFTQIGRYCYIVSSWMPETMDAILIILRGN